MNNELKINDPQNDLQRGIISALENVAEFDRSGLNYLEFENPDTGQTIVVQFTDQQLITRDAKFRLTHECHKLSSIENGQLNPPISFGVHLDKAYAAYQQIHHPNLNSIDVNQLDVIKKINLAIEILNGLKAVHSLDVVHRNISAGNIYIDNDRAILGGLGIERFMNALYLEKSNALQFATYVSPELAGALNHDVGKASDLYSIGVVLHLIFMGTPPFTANSVGDLLFQHLTVQPELDSQTNVAPALCRIIEVLLQKDPPERYQSVDSLIYDLQATKELLQNGDSTESFVICRNEIKPAVCDPAFVGRQDEMRILATELENVKKSGSQQVLVTSRSGIGKSRLILEFLRQATKAEFNVFSGRATNEAGREPMEPISAIIGQLGEWLKGQLDIRQKLRSYLTSYEQQIHDVYPEFANNLRLKKTNGKSIPEEFGQNQLENAIAQLLTKVSSPEAPLVFWFDDCQWLDEQTEKILGLIQDRNPENLLILYSMRSECPDTVNKFVDIVAPEQIVDLGPLTAEEVVVLQNR